MREMKDSGVEWIGEIPADWEIQRLKAHFGFGRGLPITKGNLQEEGIPVVSYGQIHAKTTNGVHLTADMLRFVNPEFLETNPSSLVGPGSFIVADTSEDLDGVGNAILVQESDALPLFAGYHTIILKASENRDNRYLAYLFRTDAWRSQIRANLIEVKLYSVAQKVLKEAQILVPPESEQRAIADYLDEKCAATDDVKSDTEREIALLKEYKQALITHAVTKGLDPNAEMKDSGVEWIEEIPADWRIRPLKAHFGFGKGLPITKANLQEEGVPVVSYGQIHAKTTNGVHLTEDMLRFVNPEFLETNPSSLVEPGSFIVADTSEDLDGVGNAILIQESDTFPLFAGYHTIILKAPENRDNRYLAYLFRTDAWRSQIRANLIEVKLYSVAQKVLKGAQILVPSESEQHAIADYLDEKCAAIDDQITDLEAEFIQLDEYKKSLIYDYVTGKKEVPVDAC